MDLKTLKQRQALSLQNKINLSINRIKEWYEAWDGHVYVSFSGGKDSTVLLDLVRSIYPDVPGVFSDTGLEFPEIRSFVKTKKNIITVKPKIHFKKVIEIHGYPVISKQISSMVAEYISAKKRGKKHICERILNGREKDGMFKMPEKWKFLLNAPFKISNYCCSVMKKQPLKKIELNPYIGMMALDSRMRKTYYIKNGGCNAFKKQPTSNPLGFWNEGDIWEYINQNNIQYSNIYNMGYSNTGCMFCMFGIHLDKGKNRFEVMKETHPKIYKYCKDKLNIGEVLDYINIKH